MTAIAASSADDLNQPNGFGRKFLPEPSLRLAHEMLLFPSEELSTFPRQVHITLQSTLNGNPNGALSEWCVDIFNPLQPAAPPAGTYELPQTLAAGDPGVPANLSSTQIGVMGSIMRIGDQQTLPNQFAAAQIAIWEEEYGAAFTFTGVAPSIVTLASTFLAEGQANPIPASDVIALVDIPTQPNQTLANAVPEPATWAMMGLGFAFLGFFGYRRNRTARFAISSRSPGNSSPKISALAASVLEHVVGISFVVILRLEVERVGSGRDLQASSPSTRSTRRAAFSAGSLSSSLRMISPPIRAPKTSPAPKAPARMGRVGPLSPPVELRVWG